MTARVAARELARASYILRVVLAKGAEKILAALAKDAGCTVISRGNGGGGETLILSPRGRLSDAVSVLRAKGVHSAVAAEPADYVFAEGNPLMKRLRAALKR